MQTAIYIEISDILNFSYEKPILQFVKTHFPEVIIYDLDSQSDSSIVRYATELLDKADKAVICIQASEAKTGVLLSFFEKMINCKHKCFVWFNGQNTLVEKMLSIFDDKIISRHMISPEAQQQEIFTYLSENQFL